MGLKIFLIFLFLYLTTFVHSEDYIKLTKKHMSSFSKKVKKEKGLYLAGSGGAMMNDIQVISLEYITLGTMSLEEIRSLYIELTQEFIQKLNQDTKIRPYLHDYPFGMDNLEFAVRFLDDNLEFQSNNLVCGIYCMKKTLYYIGYNPTTGKLYDILEEPYDDALKIVKAKTSPLHTNPLHST